MIFQSTCGSDRYRRERRVTGRPVTLAVVAAAILAGTIRLQAGSETSESDLPPVPEGLPPVTHPEDNPPTAAKVQLGKQLYFDPRLSRDRDISCASCHDPAKGWSNGDQFAKGFGGKLGGRNAPTIINSAYNRFQFWDGRAANLEDQALGPMQNPIEMNMTLPEVVERLNEVEGYRQQFQEVFGSEEITEERVAQAIAAYERTILSGDAPYDRFKAGDKTALSEAAQRGMSLFFGKAQCSSCHSGPSFTDNAFHNLGIGMTAEQPDAGRQEISKLQGDRGSFKTPTLREISRTAPYMHDGSMKTLEEVVEHYNQGGQKNPYLDESVFPLKLSDQEKQDLVTFLKEGLTSDSYPEHEAPELPK
jgi:cytochrome c peroxidase